MGGYPYFFTECINVILLIKGIPSYLKIISIEIIESYIFRKYFCYILC
ncbi:hypothetical protein EVA_04800 [gut metagenome]|uniref:Uncharacterized protein n=1 Tax=gut metagenome TaxID=749906 RepID=J9GIU3_9ZZZZ